ncbi:class I SAM-dependent methyltransferase [Halopseudomonas salegens]|uniref:Methyltransferase domain-containing protein n=1 Tax=Halopseudomonas salegens TaxID=1434072 RepID=A0A1H2F454_9GAMM|nr:methyltransferase domain-containing protein [Halopseudomonas salegens]SDU02043.1 Methyltransferase domain-containing protein [Halopseudomonas salegens]
MLVDSMIVVALITMYLACAHFASYQLGKKRILNQQKWGLNICCGKTDGGGVNADIVQHQDLPRFTLISSIYNLPFKTGEFDSVLCSHTIEHVDDPDAFYAELQRVGKQVTVVVPPLYDVAAVLNIWEHKWIFVTLRKQHHTLPRFVKLPFADFVQNRFGQRNHA